MLYFLCNIWGKIGFIKLRGVGVGGVGSARNACT